MSFLSFSYTTRMTQDQAFDILAMGHNVFLTGAAGTGKTFLINRFIRHAREHGIVIAVTASTGIAATHIWGMTIHSWSGMGIRDTLTDEDIDTFVSREHISQDEYIDNWWGFYAFGSFSREFGSTPSFGQIFSGTIRMNSGYSSWRFFSVATSFEVIWYGGFCLWESFLENISPGYMCTHGTVSASCRYWAQSRIYTWWSASPNSQWDQSWWYELGFSWTTQISQYSCDNRGSHGALHSQYLSGFLQYWQTQSDPRWHIRIRDAIQVRRETRRSSQKVMPRTRYSHSQKVSPSDVREE